MITDGSICSGNLAQALLPLHLEAAGTATLTVTGWSMGSLMGPSVRLRVSQLHAMPNIGDIVLVQKENGLVAHRVIKKDKHNGLIVTKGDACFLADAPVRAKDISCILTGIEEGGALRIPPRMRFPLAVMVAWNSAMQDRLHRSLPRALRRWDIFRFIYRLLEKTERWIT